MDNSLKLALIITGVMIFGLIYIVLAIFMIPTVKYRRFIFNDTRKWSIILGGPFGAIIRSFIAAMQFFILLVGTVILTLISPVIFILWRFILWPLYRFIRRWIKSMSNFKEFVALFGPLIKFGQWAIFAEPDLFNQTLYTTPQSSPPPTNAA